MNNEAMYFSLNSKSLAQNSIAHNLKFLYENVCLKEHENYIIDSVIHREVIGDIDEICDIITDNNWLLYILDNNANIWQYDYLRNQKELILKQSSGLFTNEAKLACYDGIIYIADMSSKNKLTAFSINDENCLWTINEIDDLPLFPLDIATDVNRNLYVTVPLHFTNTSDKEYRILENGALGIIKINEFGEVLEKYKYEQLKSLDGKKVSELKNIFSMEVSRSGELTVLDSETNEIYTFNQYGILQRSFKLEEAVFPSDLAIDSNNVLLISDLQSTDDKASYSSSIHRYDKSGREMSKITGLTSELSRIILDNERNIFALDKNGNSITIFVLKKQMQESSIYKSPYGTLITCSLDSTATETSWHKYVLDAHIADETQLKVSYFAMEDRELVIDNKKTDIDDFIMDSTISFEYKLMTLEKYWSEPQINPKDSLIKEACGRYLWLKIEFSGSKENTPILNKIRVYYPRISYLRYLPLVYQENPESRDFLERFLSIFESINSGLNEKIANIARYMDIDYVSGSFLRWLAGWVELTAGEEWDDDKLRMLVKNAVDIYKRRGTAGSLCKIIEIFTGEKPIIIEGFMLDKIMKEPEIKDLASKLYGMESNSFCVLIRAQAIKSIKHQSELEKIINREKPAFSEAKLIILPPHIRLDMHSYLELNSYLSDISLLHLNGKSIISNDTAIID